jgi:hypothetical protein
MTIQSQMWIDRRGQLREAPAEERWTLWGVEFTAFLPIGAELLAGSVPRWYGWVLIGVFALVLLDHVAGRLRHAAAVIDAMPVERSHPAGVITQQAERATTCSDLSE